MDWSLLARHNISSPIATCPPPKFWATNIPRSEKKWSLHRAAPTKIGLRCLVLALFLGGWVLWNLNLQLLISMIRWNSGYLKKSLLFASPQFAGWTWTRDKSWASFLVPFSNLWASSNLALLSCSFKHLKDHGKHGKVVCCWVWFRWPFRGGKKACCLFGLAKRQQLYVRTRHWRFFKCHKVLLFSFQGGSWATSTVAVGLVVVEGYYFTN